MGSSAALMTGLESFDSSLEGGATHDGAGAGLTTMLGSVGESFHSDDFAAPDGGGGWRRENGGRAGEDEYGSLLEEEEGEQGRGVLGSLMEEDDEALGEERLKPTPTARGKRAPSSSSRPDSALSGASGTRSTTATSRVASASTAPSSAAPPASTALYRLGETNSQLVDESDAERLAADSSGGLLQGLNMGDESSRDDRYRRASGSGVVAGKKKADKSGGHMTLREQEKVIDEFKKENFDLKLKIHFYEQRLDSMAPDQVNQTFRENIQLKVEYNTARVELKRHKKLLLEQDRVLDTVTHERDTLLRNGSGSGKRERELEKEVARRRDAADREREEREHLEARVKEQARELKELRDAIKKRRVDEWEGEDARAEISRLRDELDAEREAREELLGDQDELRHQLRETNDLLDEAQEDVVRLRDDGRDDNSSAVSLGDGGRRGRDKETRKELERLERTIGDLEQEKASLRSQITAQVTMLSARNAEKESLRDEVENLKQDIGHLENELDQHEKARARSERSLSSSGEDKSREQLEKENDEYRDRASAHALQVEELERQLDEKEKELEELLQDLDTRDADHGAAIQQAEDEWRQEVEDARAREAEAQGLLEEKEADIEELAEKLEALMGELAEKEAEMQADSEEVEALTDDLKKLGAQIFSLEEESEEKDARILDLETELSAVDKELEDKQALHEQVVIALKEKLSSAKSRLSECTIQLESTITENKFLREKVEDLALRTAELEEKSRSDLVARRRIEDEVEELMRALRKEEEERDLDQQEWNRQRLEEDTRWQRIFDTKDRDVKAAQSDLVQAKALVVAREADLQKLQDALNGVESDRRRLGETHTNDRFSLELELDRLKRDVARYEEDLQRERATAEKLENTLREREMSLATVTSENKEISTQLAAQTQLRLNLTDKFDSATKSLRDAHTELATTRERMKGVEDQLNTDHRALTRTEHQYRDQLTERNTLLLTVYQYMDKIDLTDKSPRNSKSDPKPFNNFPVFNDSLISRLKAVSQIQLSFERRTREIDVKFQDQFNALKRQQESRLRQLDRFEGAIKTATETQRQWRQRVNIKQLELESAKSVNADLQSQVSSLRSRASAVGSDTATAAKISILTNKAANAERRLLATQNQLALAEEKLGEARIKVSSAEGKWEARLRELEARLRAADEKVKRERQGAKERVTELGETIRGLETQVSEARRRDQQLDDVVRTVSRNSTTS